MALSSKLHAFKVQRLENILVQTAAPKVPEWPSYGNFREVIQNPHFLKRRNGGDQGTFLKNLPKSRPPLTRPKAHLLKWHYDLISMHLKGKDWRRFWGKNAAPKVPEWPSYRTFDKVIQNPHFLKFYKNRRKRCPRWKGPQALCRKWHYPLITMHLACKDWKRFWRKQRLQKCSNGQVMAILARSRKTRIF